MLIRVLSCFGASGKKEKNYRGVTADKMQTLVDGGAGFQLSWPTVVESFESICSVDKVPCLSFFLLCKENTKNSKQAPGGLFLLWSVLTEYNSA